MVLGKDKVQFLNSFTTTSVNPFRAGVVQKTNAEQTSYGITGHADPYNKGELSPVSNNGKIFDSNRWAADFGKL